jgi:hypothetical protein
MIMNSKVSSGKRANVLSFLFAFIAIQFFLSTSVLAQSSSCIPPGPANNGNNDPWSEECYLNNNCSVPTTCTANDVRVLGVYTADVNGNPLPIFNAGDTVQVYLWGQFNASSNRYAVRTTTEIFLNGVYQYDINVCSFNTLPSGTSSALLLGPITFVFGQELELKNTWVGWETANGAQCSK